VGSSKIARRDVLRTFIREKRGEGGRDIVQVSGESGGVVAQDGVYGARCQARGAKLQYGNEYCPGIWKGEG